MKKLSLLTVLLALTAFHQSLAQENKNDEKSGGNNISAFAEKLPEFSLKDTYGKKHTSKDLSKDGLILVVTVPNMKNKDEQEGWGKYLEKQKSEKPNLVFLQDMDASSFKHKARKQMKKETKAGKEPILLLDEKGDTREKLKVKKNTTVVLVYDDHQKLVLAETGDASSETADKIWKAAGK